MIGYGTRSFRAQHQHRRACREQHEQVEELVVAQVGSGETLVLQLAQRRLALLELEAHVPAGSRASS